MSIRQTLSTRSTSSEDTERLGERLGKKLEGGETIELKSDLGGGKTTLVRGLARGAGSKDHVSSPTFTISKLYKTPRFDIYHFDFYRLNEPGIIAAELAEAAGDPKNVVVVEWGGIVDSILPEGRLIIKFDHDKSGGRTITLDLPEKFSGLTGDDK